MRKKRIIAALLAVALLLPGGGGLERSTRAYAAEFPEPVLAVSFDDGTADDASGNDNNGAVVGEPAFTDGVVGKAIHLVNPEDRNKTATQYVNFGQPEDLRFGAESFTIMFWYKAEPDEAKESAIISNKDWVSGDNAGFNIGDMVEGINLNFNTVGSGRGRAETDRFAGATDGTWHHVAAVIDRKEQKQLTLYIDGEAAFGGTGSYGTRTYTADISAYTQTVDVTDFVLGADGVKKRGVADSYIDELYVYKSALSQECIQDMIADAQAFLEISEMETAISQVKIGCRYTTEAVTAISQIVAAAKESLKQAEVGQIEAIMQDLREEYEKFVDGAEPNTVFHLISDTHVTTETDTAAVNFIKGLQDMKSINPTASALVSLGDNTQNGTESEVTAFFKILKEYNPVEAGKTMIALGNHDVRGPSAYWEDVPSEPCNAYWPTAYELYMENNAEYMPETNGKTYFDFWVDGYHLIMLNPEDSPKDTAYLTEEQIAWLDEKLSENEDVDKPALVFIHQALDETHWRGNIYNGFGAQDAAVKAVLEKYPQTIIISGHIHNGFGVTEAIDRPYGTAVDVPAFQGSSSGLTKPGTGYEVYIYDDEILFRARDFVASTWLPEYNLSLKLTGLPVLVAKAKELRERDYTEESWDAVSARLKAAVSSAEILLNKKYGSWNVIPDTWLYHSDTRKEIENLQEEFVSIFAVLEEAPDLSQLLEDAIRRAQEAEKAKADAESEKADAIHRAQEAEKAKADAESEKADAIRRAQEAEKAKTDAESEKADAIRRAQEAEKARADAESEKADAIRRAQEAEKAKADAAQCTGTELSVSRVTLKSVKSPKKKVVKATWRRQENISGYVIQYSTNARFKNPVSKKISVGKTSHKLKKLKSKKKYYVRVCAYKITDKGTFYGNYSKAEKVKVR